VIYPLPRAHADGNLWVDIPQAGLMAVGDLVVTDRNPFAGDDASIGHWIALLSDLSQLEKVKLVPLTRSAARSRGGAAAARRARVGARSRPQGVRRSRPARRARRSRALGSQSRDLVRSSRPSRRSRGVVFARGLAEVVEERKKRGVDD
jgi:hypothetical protein